jgi:hypothetical protein
MLLSVHAIIGFPISASVTIDEISFNFSFTRGSSHVPKLALAVEVWPRLRVLA